MKLQFINSQYNNNMLKIKRQTLEQARFKEHKTKNNYDNVNITRPAQAISFSGSAVSLGQKLGNAFLESKNINGLIHFVNENEVAFNTIYALIVAGMLKPGLVLAQTGFNDKDGQMIATKNSLQAIVGFVLGMTVGGGFIKKIWDSMKNNMNLIKKVEENGTTILKAKSPFSEDAQEIAKTLLIKENTGLKNKLQNGVKFASQKDGLSKVGAFFDGIKKFAYIPDKNAIDDKARELIWNLKDNHLAVFNKNDNTKAFTIKLIDDLEKLKINPSTAKKELAKGLKSQPWDAFESFWKNCTNIFTVIAKAKVSSILLPIAVAAIFARKNAEAEIKNNQEKQQNKTTITINKVKENTVYDKVVSQDKKDSKVSFKGSFTNSLVDSSTKFFEKLAVSDTGQSIVDAISRKTAKPSHLMSHVESFGITLYWLLNTHFSKKIDPDQKLGLNAHTALVTILSSLASLLIDGVSDGLIDKAEKSYLSKLKDAIKTAKRNLGNNATTQEVVKEVTTICSKLYNVDEITKKLSKEGVLNNPIELEKTIQGVSCKYSKHLSKLKSLMIFTLVVRFLVPVLTVKQSKKLKKFLIDLSKKRTEKKQDVNNKEVN